MPWVRIHDGALSHPKLFALFNWKDPLHVWLWGLSQAQAHLTDGVIARDSVPKVGLRAVAVLVSRFLWEPTAAGWQIHDYHDWNDARETVIAKRKKAKARLDKWRENHDGNGVSSPLPTPLETLPHVTPLHSTKEQEQTPPTRAPVKAPPTRGQQNGRIFIHHWQLQQLISTLGPHADDFRLDVWVDGLSALADSRRLTLPKEDVWPWVQAELRAEIQRRGLPVAVAGPAAGKQTTRLAAAVENIRRTEGVS